MNDKVQLIQRVIIVALVFLASCGGSSSYEYQPARPTIHTVTYRITGSVGARADLTYENEQGNGEQQDDVILPWTKTYRMESGDFMYISAQLQSDGQIRCEILVDNVVAESAQSSGQYVIASCSGSVGR